MAKQQKRELSIELRLKGYSLQDISKELKVSKSSVSLWVRHIKLSIESQTKINEKIKINQLNFIKKFNHNKKIIYEPLLPKLIMCRKCSAELNDINWSIYNKNKNRHICKTCHTKENKEYKIKNKTKIKENSKKHYNKIKNKKKIYKKLWDEKHPNYMKEYLQTINGKIAIRKQTYKRRRELGCNSLNTYFDGCVAHHIDKENIIFVPKEINKIIYHNVYTGYNMEIVNTMAYFFLITQNINKLKEIFNQK